MISIWTVVVAKVKIAIDFHGARVIQCYRISSLDWAYAGLKKG